MISIGLTGGIASGKSVVSKMLSDAGAFVVDVDKVAQATYAKGTPGFDQVVEAFGDQVVGADGEIDRRVLGGLVFGQADALQQLTDIVWPLTRARLEAIKTEDAARAVLVFEAAVLIEAGWWDLVDQVWVVTAPLAVARERLMARNSLSRDQADARINSQMTNEERAPFADVVIENDGDFHSLANKVELAWTALTANVAQVEK